MGNIFDSCETKYIWIDKNKNQEYFQSCYNYIFPNNECLTFDKVDEGINKLLENDYEFEETIVIVSGSFFPDFYKKIISKINIIKVSPIILIFCMEKEKLLFNLKFNDIYINNFSFNKNFVFTQPYEIKNFINGVKKEKKDLVFDEIHNINELIIPCYYSYLIEDITKTEIDFFNQNIIYNFHDNNNKKKEQKIKAMLKHLKRSNFDYKTLISKYWLRIYTMETDFYSQLNKTLRKKDENHINYEPLIKICYEGVRKEFLSQVINKKLYRGCLIQKKEIEKCLELISKKK